MRKLCIATAAAALTLSASALAQEGVIIDPADPVVTGSTVVVPGAVRLYVLEQRVPSVVYEGDVVVGEPLPEIVEIHRIDGYDDYAYTVVNEQRVIVDPQTRAIVQIVE